MRVNAISAYNFGTQNCKSQKVQKRNQLAAAASLSADTVNFKGWRAGGGGILGGLAGVGLGTLLTIGTGGLAAPLVLAALGTTAGCIGGSIAESKKGGDDDDDGPDDTDPTMYRMSHYD